MQERFNTFTVLIAKINRTIRRIKTEEMAGFDLKSTHVSCLYYLYINEALTSKELCDICMEDKASVSRSIEYLENKGYLKPAEKESKRYKRLLELTEKGKEIGKRLYEKINEILDQSSKGITEDERETMYRSLESISENLQKICDKYDN
ncbi:MAG: winged helix DNA-binding protein [Clostridia bacterium]|jgi:DNA-binding MarR family transcriptional regulator|nr:winged helix DNA-binding protein [Clostridia bacterium]MBQ2252291.1 winged helix DNA-binding protein [Clostridia bacterium]MBQ5602752.1 winged helix DNA-binding protein [Clostridia bacterium]